MFILPPKFTTGVMGGICEPAKVAALNTGFTSTPYLREILSTCCANRWLKYNFSAYEAPHHEPAPGTNIVSVTQPPMYDLALLIR